MAESIKDKAREFGHDVAETASKVGHKIGEGLEEAADWAKEKTHQVGNRMSEAAQKVEHGVKETLHGGDTYDVADASITSVKEHMDVYGSCGNKLGRVDHVQGDSIKLTKNDSPDGMHHLIPSTWISRVDEHVHLNKSCGEAAMEWHTV